MLSKEMMERDFLKARLRSGIGKVRIAPTNGLTLQ